MIVNERYAFISDVHGNLESLQRALERVRDDDKLVCLGDSVGYGPNPNECVRVIRDRVHAAVLGNHDLAAVDNFGLKYFNEPAKIAIAWTQGIIDADNLAWLNELPYELRFPEFLLVHGAPKDYFTYILDKQAAARAFAATDARIIFIGHTHIAEYYACDAKGNISHKHMQHGGELVMEEGSRYIIDVGSVGQPRDLNPLASMVFYEPERNRIEWVRFDYPIATVQQKIHDAKLPDSLAQRLESGR